MVDKWQRAFVLHRRSYSESSLLVDFFIEHHGRITLLAKGARRKQSIQKGILQPFTPLIIQYSGRGELKSLTRIEAMGLMLPLGGSALYSAFYLNELLHRVLHPEMESSHLFDHYLQSIKRLAQQESPEVVLRQFELELLTFLGYPIDLTHCYGSGEPIHATMHYQYHPEKGFLASLLENSRSFLGEDLLAIERRDFQQKTSLQAAKRFTRLALKPYIGSQPFKSRDLFKKL